MEGSFDLEDIDPLGILNSLTDEDIGELERLTNPEIPTANELENLFGT